MPTLKAAIIATITMKIRNAIKVIILPTD
jgi:hypothetical protein